MPNRPNRDTTQPPTQIPTDHHHGGRELPDDVQDRPEQNAGYDAAVRGDDLDRDPAADPLIDNDGDLDLTDLDALDREEDTDDEKLH